MVCARQCYIESTCDNGLTNDNEPRRNIGNCLGTNTTAINNSEITNVSQIENKQETKRDEPKIHVRKDKERRKVISRSKITQNSDIKKKLKCINTNAQSLQYKMDELKQVIKDNDVKIVAVNESWGQEWKEMTLEIDGFVMYKKTQDRWKARGWMCLICEPRA